MQRQAKAIEPHPLVLKRRSGNFYKPEHSAIKITGQLVIQHLPRHVVEADNRKRTIRCLCLTLPLIVLLLLSMLHLHLLLHLMLLLLVLVLELIVWASLSSSVSDDVGHAVAGGGVRGLNMGLGVVGMVVEMTTQMVLAMSIVHLIDHMVVVVIVVQVASRGSGGKSEGTGRRGIGGRTTHGAAATTRLVHCEGLKWVSVECLCNMWVGRGKEKGSKRSRTDGNGRALWRAYEGCSPSIYAYSHPHCTKSQRAGRRSVARPRGNK